MSTRIVCFLLLPAALLFADEKYSGPIPPKPDLPYLLHASSLVATEVAQAKEEHRKNDTVYVIAGANSAARTPLPEPIFIIDAQQMSPGQIELYQLEVKDGSREVSMSTKGGKNAAHPLHLLVTRLAEHLYKIEASEELDAGEYALTPGGDNRVFCFAVY